MSMAIQGFTKFGCVWIAAYIISPTYIVSWIDNKAIERGVAYVSSPFSLLFLCYCTGEFIPGTNRIIDYWLCEVYNRGSTRFVHLNKGVCREKTSISSFQLTQWMDDKGSTVVTLIFRTAVLCRTSRFPGNSLTFDVIVVQLFN
jgi:hypothetical protein